MNQGNVRHADLFTRGGRPSALTLARLEAGELLPAERASVEAALGETEQAELAALAAVELVPSPEVLAAARRKASADGGRTARAKVLPGPWTTYVLSAVALAAVALLAVMVVRPPSGPVEDSMVTPAEDGIRTKGVEFGFELLIDDGDANRRVADGGEVRPGVSIAFKAYPRRDGELSVILAGADGSITQMYPGPALAIGAGDRPGSAPVKARGGELRITPTLRDGMGGVALDATPGDEHFVALLCEAGTDVSWTAGEVLRARNVVPKGCLREDVRVRKVVEADR